MLFSARKVGPKVYTSESPWAMVSTFSCPLTVRQLLQDTMRPVGEHSAIAVIRGARCIASDRDANVCIHVWKVVGIKGEI